MVKALMSSPYHSKGYKILNLHSKRDDQHLHPFRCQRMRVFPSEQLTIEVASFFLYFTCISWQLLGHYFGVVVNFRKGTEYRDKITQARGQTRINACSVLRLKLLSGCWGKNTKFQGLGGVIALNYWSMMFTNFSPKKSFYLPYGCGCRCIWENI